MDKAQVALIVAVVAVVIAGFATFGHSSKALFGSATSCTDGYTCVTNLETQGNSIVDGTSLFSSLMSLTAGIKVGSTGTQINGVNFGTCYIQANATTIAASSTATVDCQSATNGTQTALTGIATNDTVNTWFSTTTPTTFGGGGVGLRILGSSASSTAGFITMLVFNGTGNTFTWTSAASTTKYAAFR